MPRSTRLFAGYISGQTRFDFAILGVYTHVIVAVIVILVIIVIAKRGREWITAVGSRGEGRKADGKADGKDWHEGDERRDGGGNIFSEATRK